MLCGQRTSWLQRLRCVALPSVVDVDDERRCEALENRCAKISSKWTERSTAARAGGQVVVRGKREEMYSTGRSSSWSGLRQSCVRGVAAGGLVDCWLFGGLDVSRPVILTYTDELTRAAPLHSQRSMSLVRSITTSQIGCRRRRYQHCYHLSASLLAAQLQQQPRRTREKIQWRSRFKVPIQYINPEGI